MLSLLLLMAIYCAHNTTPQGACVHTIRTASYLSIISCVIVHVELYIIVFESNNIWDDCFKADNLNICIRNVNALYLKVAIVHVMPEVIWNGSKIFSSIDLNGSLSVGTWMTKEFANKTYLALMNTVEKLKWYDFKIVCYYLSLYLNANILTKSSFFPFLTHEESNVHTVWPKVLPSLLVRR